MGAKFPVGSVKEEEVRVFREMEREKVHMILDEYLRICQQRGVCLHLLLLFYSFDVMPFIARFVLLHWLVLQS